MPAPLTFTINNAVQGGFTLPVATANGTAMAGQDFTAVTGNVHFEGKPGEAQSLRVVTLADDTVERNETIQPALSALTELPASVASLISVQTAVGTEHQ